MIETQTGGKDYGDGVLDVLSTAAKWFREPKPGDAIFLMTMGFESEHKAGYSKVQKEMATRQVRVFGLFFAPIIVASPEGGIGLARSGAAGSEHVVTYGFIQNQDAASLSRSSGGYMIQTRFSVRGTRVYTFWGAWGATRHTHCHMNGYTRE